MIISIVTPTLNADLYLAQCIDSVKRNACAGVEPEHIIVDGGSTDATLEIARAKGVRVITGKDSGIFDAINKGSLASSGELIGFLGADDMLLQGSLQAVANEYRRGRPRWLTGGYSRIDGMGNYLYSKSAPPAWFGLRMYASLGWCCMAHISTYLTRDLFEELGGFNTDFTVAGDYELFARAWSRCEYQRVRRILAVSRFTEMNFSHIQTARRARDCAAIAEAFGPRSAWERTLYGMGLRTWIRADKLAWCIKQRRLSPQFTRTSEVPFCADVSKTRS